MTGQFAILNERAVLEIGGPDRADFLQGLISNDVTRLNDGRAIYAALLTAQGRYLHDFFLVASGDTYLLDGEAARLPDLTRRLTIYKLRSKVTLTSRPDLAVCAIFGDPAPLPAAGAAFADPRNAALGTRLILPRDEIAALPFAQTDAANYDRLRLSLGVPDGSRDLVPEKSLLMESGFDALNGIDWNKGCYIGQEITARMKYRALVKKQLMPVSVDGPMPAPGTAILSGDDEVGEMRSGRDGTALAVLRLDALDKALRAGEAQVTPTRSV
jgi:folate-binding protein YgfZ